MPLIFSTLALCRRLFLSVLLLPNLASFNHGSSFFDAAVVSKIIVRSFDSGMSCRVSS
jgi:hypothetical protein